MTSDIIKIINEEAKNSKTNIWEKYGLIIVDKIGFGDGLREVGT